MSRHKYDGWLQVAPGTYQHRLGRIKRLKGHWWTTKARNELRWSKRVYPSMWRAMQALERAA
jgi:hypothetical protein